MVDQTRCCIDSSIDFFMYDQAVRQKASDEGMFSLEILQRKDRKRFVAFLGKGVVDIMPAK